jgi:TRAP-type C4-dicarboxylate transport system substrate-binding protein
MIIRRVWWRGFVAVALVAAATACGGSGGDKAGGGNDGKPVVLTLESEDDLTLSGAPEFADAVRRLSGGALRITFLQAGRGLEVDYERGVVNDVRRGRAELGIVAARVWDTMGVPSFQALLAPLLVDSYEAERRVVESPLAARMLDGVERAGLVGIALLPGPLRWPLGMTHPFLGPEDYRGATVAIRLGNVARDTFRELGGTARGYVPGDLSGFDAAESDPKAVDYNGFEGVFTTNVVLWPRPWTIVMNRGAFDALTTEQQELLRRAGRGAIAPELDQIMQDAAASLAQACRRSLVSLAVASNADLAAFRRAVQPVYRRLERDARTRRFLGQVRALRGGGATETLPSPCNGAGSNGATASAAALEGRWTYTWTRPELLAAGIAEKHIPKGVQRATLVLEFRGGRYRAIGDGVVLVRGTYTVDGDVLNLVHPPGSRGYAAGQVYRQRWSLYRGKLTFRRLPGSDVDLVLVVKPLTRVR